MDKNSTKAEDAIIYLAEREKEKENKEKQNKKIKEISFGIAVLIISVVWAAIHFSPIDVSRINPGDGITFKTKSFGCSNKGSFKEAMGYFAEGNSEKLGKMLQGGCSYLKDGEFGVLRIDRESKFINVMTDEKNPTDIWSSTGFIKEVVE